MELVTTHSDALSLVQLNKYYIKIIVFWDGQSEKPDATIMKAENISSPFPQNVNVFLPDYKTSQQNRKNSFSSFFLVFN